jgi:hypothetical protein
MAATNNHFIDNNLYDFSTLGYGVQSAHQSLGRGQQNDTGQAHHKAAALRASQLAFTNPLVRYSSFSSMQG